MGWGFIFGVFGVIAGSYAVYKSRHVLYLNMRSKYIFVVCLAGFFVAAASLAIPSGDTSLIQYLDGSLIVATTIVMAIAPTFYEKIKARNNSFLLEWGLPQQRRKKDLKIGLGRPYHVEKKDVTAKHNHDIENFD